MDEKARREVHTKQPEAEGRMREGEWVERGDRNEEERPSEGWMPAMWLQMLRGGR